MKILVVEDDYISRTVLIRQLSVYGECDVAVNGTEALLAFDEAWESQTRYDLICLDIMMPEMDGQEVLARRREKETERGVEGFDGVKIVMTTALGDKDNIIKAFHNQCEGYLVKPVVPEKLNSVMVELGFTPVVN
ncbi:MAG: response regulator [Deltaproteobacteria bacterium]|nr:response regulator [Deltaproteobacteria bacterium]